KLAALAPAELPPFQRLRCWRNGSTLLKGALVVPVVHRLAAALGGSPRRDRALGPAHELHTLGDYLDDSALLSVLRLPVPGLQLSFHQDGAPLVQILPTGLRLLAPHHHGEEARLFPLLAALRGVVSVDGEPGIGHRGTARRIANLRGAGQVPDGGHTC